MKKAGFSMIEVLVASSILVVIVMMMGMLFQQGSNAWRIGSKRADGFMKLRTFLGALQRDASEAVDVNTIIADRTAVKLASGSSSDPLSSALKSKDQEFAGSDLIFYTLNGVTNRAITRLTYNLGTFTRQEEYIKPGETQFTSLGSKKLVEMSSDGASLPKFTSAKAYWDNGNGNLTTSEKNALPAFITFSATVEATDYALDIGAESAGPDGKWGTKDDITTWNEE